MPIDYFGGFLASTASPGVSSGEGYFFIGDAASAAAPGVSAANAYFFVAAAASVAASGVSGGAGWTLYVVGASVGTPGISALTGELSPLGPLSSTAAPGVCALHGYAPHPLWIGGGRRVP